MIRQLNSRESALLAVCILAISTAACEKQVEITSKWCDLEMDFNGSVDQWGPATIYAEKEKVSLTLLNDNDYIYIRLYTRDRVTQGQVLMAGFTVWFNADGGKNKSIGIRFPLGGQAKGMPVMARAGMQNEEAIERMVGEMDEMEILGPDERPVYRMFLVEAASLGIDAKVSMVKGNLVYELKFPLIKRDEYPYTVGIEAIEIAASKAIGIGFETPRIDMEQMRKSRGAEGMPEMPPGGGGMPPGSGGMPPGGGERPAGGGGRPPGGQGMPEPLKLWTKVTLASLSRISE